MNSSRMLLKVAHCVYCAVLLALGFADVVQGGVQGGRKRNMGNVSFSDDAV